jgi:hypothetical protein
VGPVCYGVGRNYACVCVYCVARVGLLKGNIGGGWAGVILGYKPCSLGSK